MPVAHLVHPEKVTSDPNWALIAKALEVAMRLQAAAAQSKCHQVIAQKPCDHHAEGG